MEPNNQNTPKHETLYEQLAINTIRLNAINNRVIAARLSFGKAIQMHSQSEKGIVRTMSFSKMAMRIAAVLLMLAGSATVYKYATVDTLSLYNEHFTSYELGSTRGETKPDVQVYRYQNANWKDVVAINNMALVQANKSRFLAGMAEMEMKHYPQAAKLFTAVLANKMDESFQEEAEYYGALSYLASHNVKKAVTLINQIKSNPDHKYYPMAQTISAIDLKIIAFKNK